MFGQCAKRLRRGLLLGRARHRDRRTGRIDIVLFQQLPDQAPAFGSTAFRFD